MDKYGAKAASTRQHHPTKVKFMAIASVPSVIQNGRLIHSEFHNGKQSYTYAAPVDFMGKPIYVAAIVHEVIQDGKPTHKFYLDEVVDIDGYRFNIDKIEAPTDPKYGATTKSGATETPEMLPIDSIRSTGEESNPQNEEAADVFQNTNPAGNGTNPEENARNGGENAQSQNNVPAGNENRSLQELRRELAAAEEEYAQANQRNDTEYDFEGQAQRIRELTDAVERAEDAEKDSSPAAQNDRENGTAENADAGRDRWKNNDPHPDRRRAGRERRINPLCTKSPLITAIFMLSG